MRARLPKFAAALCAAVALVTAPAALASTSALSPALAAGPYHWYDSSTATPGA
jgi:hypothetical protein